MLTWSMSRVTGLTGGSMVESQDQIKKKLNHNMNM